MTNQASVPQSLPHGLSENDVIYLKAVCPGVVTATSGTWTLTPPDGVPIDAIPVNWTIWRPGSPDTLLYPNAAAPAVTSMTFDPTTGTIVITNGATALAAGDVLYLLLMAN